MDKNSKIVVVGLGYVGLPLAVALARTYPVIGFDIDAGRVSELEGGEDRTREVEPDRLKASTLVYSAIPPTSRVPTYTSSRCRPRSAQTTSPISALSAARARWSAK